MSKKKNIDIQVGDVDGDVGKTTEDLLKTFSDKTTATTTSTPTVVPMSYGWICPKCGRVNAPWKGHCDCCNGIAVPYTPPNTPKPSPLVDPVLPVNPYNPYGPYKWGDQPGWWNQGPTCTPYNPCIKPGTANDPNFGKSTTINTQFGGDSHLQGWNRGV